MIESLSNLDKIENHNRVNTRGSKKINELIGGCTTHFDNNHKRQQNETTRADNSPQQLHMTRASGMIMIKLMDYIFVARLLVNGLPTNNSRLATLFELLICDNTTRVDVYVANFEN